MVKKVCRLTIFTDKSDRSDGSERLLGEGTRKAPERRSGGVEMLLGLGRDAVGAEYGWCVAYLSNYG